MKKKACRKCRVFVKGNKCPLCNSEDTTTSWKGKILILDANKSEVAKNLGIKSKGEYVIKVK